MAWTNYHSHTKYCDGSNNPEDYIKEAIELGTKAYGFSSHAPINFFTEWCIKDSELLLYYTDICNIKKKYQNEIETYIGLEIDYIPGVAGYSYIDTNKYKLDFFIGSIHFVDKFDNGEYWNIDHCKESFDKGLSQIFRNNFRKACETFYELTVQMVKEDNPDIIGHLDKIKMFNIGSCYFNEDEKWYKGLIDYTLKEIKASNSIIEVNTRGYYRYGQLDLYPSNWILQKIIDLKIPLILNSDNHSPTEITAGFEYTANELNKLGLKELWILYNDKWRPVGFSPDGYNIN